MWTASGPRSRLRAERPNVEKASYDEIAELAHSGAKCCILVHRDCMRFGISLWETFRATWH